ncbi:MAG: host attachment protein [Chromatiaceae bacterium]|nr:host attachment protein [Gammaproteobacteria bacterium]MCP5312905.1 host attachment protein [Chromatiaceae bacterium]
MSKIWVVVADASRARIFTASKPADGLTEVETLSNPEGRLHEGDLVSDRGGRISAGEGARHGYGAGSSAKDETINRFAATVCKHLERGRNSRAFGKLYVVAAPQFLGMMRKHQSDPLRGLISDEIATELTTQSAERIRAQLPEFL